MFRTSRVPSSGRIFCKVCFSRIYVSSLKMRVQNVFLMMNPQGSRIRWSRAAFNPLKAELNPICHLLILLGDLTFMGPCTVSIFQYISNKMQRYTVYLYLETALHVSGGTSTHHQERIQLYLQHLVFV